MPDSDKENKRVSVNFHFTDLNSWADGLFDVDKHNYIVGLNSGIGGAISTVCYQSLANVICRIALPTFCGLAASELWLHFISRPLQKGSIDCPVCVATRGMTIALGTATVFPALLGGALLARGKFRFSNRSGHIFEELVNPYRYSVSKRPLLAAAIITQVSLGFMMADREFDVAIRRLYSDDEVAKGRVVVRPNDSTQPLTRDDLEETDNISKS